MPKTVIKLPIRHPKTKWKQRKIKNQKADWQFTNHPTHFNCIVESTQECNQIEYEFANQNEIGETENENLMIYGRCVNT